MGRIIDKIRNSRVFVSALLILIIAGTVFFGNKLADKEGLDPAVSGALNDDRYARAVVTGEGSGDDIKAVLDSAKAAGDDIICVYLPDTSSEQGPSGTVPEKETLRGLGFDEISGGEYYAGIRRNDAGVLQQRGEVPFNVLYDAEQGAEIKKDPEKSVSTVLVGKEEHIYGPGLHIITVRVLKSRMGDAGAEDNMIGFWEQIGNDDHITVIGTSGTGSKYMPGVVNDALEKIGLLPIDKGFGRPYIAILNGREVIFNDYGDPEEETSAHETVEGIEIFAVSNADPGEKYCYMSVAGEEIRITDDGLVCQTYDKEEGQIVTARYFNWKNNFATNTDFDRITNVYDLLDAASSEGDDIICVYSQENASDGLSEYVLNALHNSGFKGLTEEGCYAGIKIGEEIRETVGAEAAELKVDREGVEIGLKSGAENTASFDGVVYTAEKEGLYIIIYNPEKKAVLTEKYYTVEKLNIPSPFEGISRDPVACLGQLNNEDYITMIGVSGDGLKYMPAVVNDKLKEMGLMPLEGPFRRPYLAILNGGKVVYNEYGAEESEISTEQETDGVRITLASNTTGKNQNFYTQIGEKILKEKGTGLVIRLYSEKYGKTISSIRFNWADNYVTGTAYADITNIRELLFRAQQEGNDILCVYSAERAENGIPEDVLNALHNSGFKGLTEGGCYAGIKTGEEIRETVGAEAAELKVDREGVEIELKSGAENTASFDGVVYTAEKEGLYIIIYNPEKKAVLTEKYYADPVVEKPDPFAGLAKKPVEYLRLLDNDDYISVIVVSMDAARYLPGMVNDQLTAMGLIPLKGKVHQPYIAVLNGGEVVYNETGEAYSEIMTECDVDGIPVNVISNTMKKKYRAYISVGAEEYTKRTQGMTVYVYSKADGALVNVRRFNWTTVNYVTEDNYSNIVNVRELILQSGKSGADVICLYSPALAPNGVPDDVQKALKDKGFTDFDPSTDYAAVLRGDGEVQQVKGEKPLSLAIQSLDKEYTLSVGEKREVVFEDITYTASKEGLYMMVYFAEEDAVLAEKYY